MTTKITEECINCGACEPECPNTAIYAGAVEYEWQGAKQRALSDDFYYIVPEKCTECVGFFDREACAAACPVDCCIPDPDCPETEEVLIARAKLLHPDKQFATAVPSRFRKTERAEPLPARGASAVVEPAPAQSQPAPVAAPQAAAAVQPVAPQKPAVATPPSAAPQPPTPQAAAAQSAPVAEQKPAAAARTVAPHEPASELSPTAASAGASADSRGDDGSVRTLPRATTTANFETLRDAVCGPRSAHRSLLGRLAGRLGRAGARGNGSPGFDGFSSAAFESKRERERRYGEVYRVEEHHGGYYVRLELPRTVPPSAAKARLGIGDEMPDYDVDVTLSAPELTVSGHVAQPDLRALCGISSAFPPDFRTSIHLAGSLGGLGYRYSDKVLEIVVSRRQDRRTGRPSA